MSKENRRFFEFGPFRIDTLNRQLWRDGEAVPLKAKAVETLLLLIDRRGDVVEKDELMRELWPDSFVEEANLTQNIYTLRKALGDGDYIETIPRRGYRFAAQVMEKPAATSDLIIIKETTSTRISYEEENNQDSDKVINAPSLAAQLTAGQPQRRIWLWAVVALVCVAGTAVAVLLWWGHSQKPFENIKLTKFTTTGKAIKAAISPDGKFIAFVLNDGGQQSVWMRQKVTGQDLQLVAAARTDIYGLTFTRDGNYIFYVSQEQNHLAMLYRVPSLGGSSDKLLEDVDSPVTFSPDGRQMAFIRFSPGHASVVIANIDGSGEKTLTTTRTEDELRIGPNGVLPPSWSPDGEIIACPVSINSVQWDQTVYGYRTKDGGGVPLTTNHWPSIARIEWMPDGGGILATILETESTTEHQVWFVPYPKGEARRITNDLIDYRDLGVSADARTIITIQSEKKANLWLAPIEDLDHPAQLTATSYDGLNGMSWTPDGKLVYTSVIAGEQNLWITQPNGGSPKQLTSHAGFHEQPAVSPDGRYIVFLSNRNGQEHLWRIDIDGKHPLQLTQGIGDRQPTFTADSQFVIFRSRNPSSLFRVSINGGDAVRLTERGGFDPNVSPDGKTIACGFRPAPADKNRIATMAIEGGEPKIITDWPALNGRMRWMPDGAGLAYAARQASVGNIWVQPLDGSPAKQLTHWHPAPIFSFDWSRDGKWLAYASGSLTSDVVLIADTRR
jgi:eukaryotic-like serine/threonine-protein kinase